MSKTKQLRKRHTFFYGVADFIMAMLAWAIFFGYRKNMEGVPFSAEIFSDLNFYYGVFIVPLGWVLLYSIFGHYTDIYRMARLNTLTNTFLVSFLGVTVLFFTLILDDVVSNDQTYFYSFFCLFCL